MRGDLRGARREAALGGLAHLWEGYLRHGRRQLASPGQRVVLAPRLAAAFGVADLVAGWALGLVFARRVSAVFRETHEVGGQRQVGRRTPRWASQRHRPERIGYDPWSPCLLALAAVLCHDPE